MATTTLTGGTPTATGLPAATTSASGGNGSGGPTSSPLLFFVALGFGVVFTNLWIIVGVKYCFRYNQRNRRAQNDENGEPIDMTAMPRTHRRRREKKLMTMDEVNERFPLVKYKAWMTSRAEEGLPTAGGVAAPSESRAASLRNAEGVLGSDRKSHDVGRSSTPEPKQSSDVHVDSSEVVKVSSATEPTITTPAHAAPEPVLEASTDTAEDDKKAATSQVTPTDAEAASKITVPLTQHVTGQSSTEPVEDDLDDDDQIQMAVPSEMLNNPGDSCAICIDTLEDDDDVRGLTCGHAFHASCLDPWLTSRRACCPLCKADYYVPKPRPEGETSPETERAERIRRNLGTRIDMPQRPTYAFQRGGGRMLFPGRFRPGNTDPTQAQNQGYRLTFPSRVARPGRAARENRDLQAETTSTAPEVQSEQPETWRSRMRGLMTRTRRNDTSSTSGESTIPLERNNDSTSTEPTPAELEAGRR